MASNERAQWAMDVVLVCHVTPPADVLRQAVDQTCGSDCQIAADEGRRVVTVETDAIDAPAAVAELQAKAQRLVDRLSDFDCAIELTSRLEDRSAPVEPPQAGSLGER